MQDSCGNPLSTEIKKKRETHFIQSAPDGANCLARESRVEK